MLNTVVTIAGNTIQIMKHLEIYVFFAFFLTSAVSAQERNYSQQFAQCSKVASTANRHADCIVSEIAIQKKRLNAAYTSLVKTLAPEDKKRLDRIQHEWITWRDDNYNFLAEHVSGSFSTTRATSLDFILRSVFNRASELEMILDEKGAN